MSKRSLSQRSFLAAASLLMLVVAAWFGREAWIQGPEADPSASPRSPESPLRQDPEFLAPNLDEDVDRRSEMRAQQTIRGLFVERTSSDELRAVTPGMGRVELVQNGSRRVATVERGAWEVHAERGSTLQLEAVFLDGLSRCLAPDQTLTTDTEAEQVLELRPKSALRLESTTGVRFAAFEYVVGAIPRDLESALHPGPDERLQTDTRLLPAFAQETPAELAGGWLRATDHGWRRISGGTDACEDYVVHLHPAGTLIVELDAALESEHTSLEIYSGEALLVRCSPAGFEHLTFSGLPPGEVAARLVESSPRQMGVRAEAEGGIRVGATTRVRLSPLLAGTTCEVSGRIRLPDPATSSRARSIVIQREAAEGDAWSRTLTQDDGEFRRVVDEAALGWDPMPLEPGTYFVDLVPLGLRFSMLVPPLETWQFEESCQEPREVSVTVVLGDGSEGSDWIDVQRAWVTSLGELAPHEQLSLGQRVSTPSNPFVTVTYSDRLAVEGYSDAVGGFSGLVLVDSTGTGTLRLPPTRVLEVRASVDGVETRLPPYWWLNLRVRDGETGASSSLRSLTPLVEASPDTAWARFSRAKLTFDLQRDQRLGFPHPHRGELLVPLREDGVLSLDAGTGEWAWLASD